ncbi:uncharacterized protein LOC141656277 [Silene latifolia]|uniref:uncharacterized protein LOC141656277 n=1 Tax=Silene latifolia TaxID=37657 RepID=UPI003D7853CD
MEMHDKDERQISCREYYCYKLQNRPSNMMLRACRCFQQYVVDMYVKIENTRLDFFRNNQDTIQAELYQGILDTVDAEECCAANVGRRVILRRLILEKCYLNAMVLVQKYGKPDLFITMTCNANWTKIQERLVPGELAQNRPDIVARFFRAKLLTLKKKITEVQVFGEVAAYIYVVEFQKRGLPHAHFLIILKPDYKMKGTSDYDKFVSAEIPPPSYAALRASLRPEENLQSVIANEKRARTPLTEFFTESNKQGTEKLLYGEFTTKYRWDKSEKRWIKRRKKLIMIGRLVFVAPSEGERYFLRLLFLHIRGPKSFEELKTVNGYKYATFQETAVKCRLIEEDDTVNLCLSEACEVQMPSALRRLFATKNKRINDALDAPIPKDCNDCRDKLNPGQQEAFDSIIPHVREGKPSAFFIDGPSGIGKTFFYNALYAEVRLMGKIILPKATSGIDASNIPSRRTSHSRIKIPLNDDGSLSCNIPKQGSLAALIRECSLIIWDEASMAKKSNVEALYLLLRDLCHPNIPFGVENIRAQEDHAYSSFLLALGNGELQTDENQYVELPWEIVRESGCSEPDPINEITSVAFPELDLRDFNSDIFTTRAILTPINDDVDAINSVLINKFPGVAITYKGFDTMLDDKCNICPAEFVKNLCQGGISPHELILKENCPVILLRNILPSFDLCNGTRLICKRFFPDLIECMITTSRNKGRRVLIPRVKLRPSDSTNYPFQF